MTKAKAVECLNSIEDCLLRAETGKKDLDLIVALRVLYLLMLDEVKKFDQKE